MRRAARILVSLAFVVVGVLGAAPAGVAAASAYPARAFELNYGNTYTKGVATFYNRNVRLVGEHKAQTTSGCRSTTAHAFTVSGELIGFDVSTYTCKGSAKFDFTVPADVRGGAFYIEVSLSHYYPAERYHGPLMTHRIQRS